jgi:hypothetical protein
MKDNNIEEILRDSLFFTGAGFSKAAGCKLSSEMLKDLEERSNNKNGIFLESERKAIKFILSCLDYQARYRTPESNGQFAYIPNIEEFAQLLRRIKNRENLLPYPVTGNWSDKIISIENENKIEISNPEYDIWTSIENKIKKVCYDEWLRIENNKLSYLNNLKKLLQSINENIKIDIFTLNNDLVLETYFKDENSVYIGFVSNKWVGFERENIDDSTFNASRINLYKLHGSIDWIRLIDGTIAKKSILTSDPLNNDNGEIEIDPFLIFGHGTKIYTIDPFFSLLEYFKQALRKKKYFFVIGYSFFDPHINNLFFNELLNSPRDKYLFIFNPGLADLKEDDFQDKTINGLTFKNVLKDDNKTNLVDYFVNIQRNPIYTEMPDFNIKKISPESFEYIKENAQKFLSKIDTYMKFVAELIRNKQKENEIF